MEPAKGFEIVNTDCDNILQPCNQVPQQVTGRRPAVMANTMVHSTPASLGITRGDLHEGHAHQGHHGTLASQTSPVVSSSSERRQHSQGVEKTGIMYTAPGLKMLDVNVSGEIPKVLQQSADRSEQKSFVAKIKLSNQVMVTKCRPNILPGRPSITQALKAPVAHVTPTATKPPNITFIRHQPGTTVTQMINTLQPAGFTPEGVNLNYLGCFVMNQKTQVCTQPTSVALGKTVMSARQESSPGLLPSQTFSATSLQQPSNVLNSLTASALLQQMMVNQVQPINQQTITVPAVGAVQIPNQVQLSLPPGNSPTVLTAGSLAQGMVAGAQLIRTLGPGAQTVHHAGLAQNIAAGVAAAPAAPSSLPPSVMVPLGAQSSSQPLVTHVHSSVPANLSSSLAHGFSSPAAQMSYRAPIPRPQESVVHLNTLPGSPVTTVGLSPVPSMRETLVSRLRSQHLDPSPIRQGAASAMVSGGQSDKTVIQVFPPGSLMSSSIPHDFQGNVSLNPASSKPVPAEPSIMSGANIVKIVVPGVSGSTTAPFVNNLPQSTALRILKEMASGPHTSSALSSGGNMVTINANNHPKLRNLLHAVEKQLGGEVNDGKQSLTTAQASTQKLPQQLSKVTSPQSFPVRNTPSKTSPIDPAYLRQLLQTRPLSASPSISQSAPVHKAPHTGPTDRMAPETTHISPVDGTKPGYNNIVMKRILKHKVASKPSILSRKRAGPAWLKHPVPAKKMGVTVMEKNGVMTGYVCKSLGRQMDTVCQKSAIQDQSPQLAKRMQPPLSRKPQITRREKVLKPRATAKPSSLQRPKATGKIFSSAHTNLEGVSYMLQ